LLNSLNNNDNKNNMKFLLISLLAALLVVGCHAQLEQFQFRKLALAEYDIKEINYLKSWNRERTNKNQTPFVPDTQLSEWAQAEANRLASQLRLSLPPVPLAVRHFGYSFKVFGEARSTLGKKH
jgi:hypothetical protein